MSAAIRPRQDVRWLRVGVLAISLLLVPARPLAAAGSHLPGAESNLVLRAPVDKWDEAVPLGNGLLGGLLWGEGQTIRLSLDRGDLWDLRTPAATHEKGFTYANLQKLVREQNVGEINRLTDAPYNQSTPTKLPAGRLEIVLDPARTVTSFELDLARAEGRVRLSDGTSLVAFFSAVQPVALIRIPGAAPQEIRLRIPGGGAGGDTGPDSHAVASLGYPPAKTGSDRNTRWFVQDTVGGLSYCVCARSLRLGEATLIAVTVTSTADGPDPLTLARARLALALKSTYAAAIESHAAWWADFWSQSRVQIPEPDIQRQYDLVRYFHGASSRRGAPPMPLQGVWTADAGSLPPWKGDYHNDLNTQMSYMGYQGAGHFDEGRCFLDFNEKLLPRYRRFAREFFGTPGANVPGVMSLSGDPLTGWAQYSLSPTAGAWVAHLFYLHWRYTGDDHYLREVAYPWCREVGQCLRALLRSDAQGVLRLPLSSSPEIHDNSLKAWLAPNSNYDLFCMKMLFLSLSEMADEAGDTAEASQWTQLAAALGPYHVDAQGMLLIDATQPLPASHRHLSNLMGLYPFNLVTCEGGERDRTTIKASLAQWDRLGTGAWCGYSFSWMSALRARVGDPEAAVRNLDIFVKAFLLRNGFHANGDQTKSGFSGFTYRPFTLEGNMLAAAAVHEMLLQSWSPPPGRRDTEVIRIFPATPWRWHDASFDDLRAEGGHRGSARRENNATTWLRVVAGRDGPVRLRDNFGGRAPRWNRDGVTRVGENYVVPLKSGESLEATLEKPSRVPPAPLTMPLRRLSSNADPLPFPQAMKTITASLVLCLFAASPALSNERIDLAGEWRLRLDPDDLGVKSGWPSQPLAGNDRMVLPNTTDRAGFGFALDPKTMLHAAPFPVTTRFPGVKDPTRADEHGYLVRRHLFVRPAWYERELDVPASWAGRVASLRIERAMWKTDVWIDGRPSGSCDSLVAEHRHDLGVLEPGKHWLTVRVDNRMIHNITTITHAYGPETQTRWNGMIGAIELVSARAFGALRRGLPRGRPPLGAGRGGPRQYGLRGAIGPADGPALQGEGRPLPGRGTDRGPHRTGRRQRRAHTDACRTR
jgi:alpha-L-fucosidase 2